MAKIAHADYIFMKQSLVKVGLLLTLLRPSKISGLILRHFSMVSTTIQSLGLLLVITISFRELLQKKQYFPRLTELG